MVKGQTEIMIILGVVIVAVVVALYAFQVPLIPEPAGVGEAKKMLSDNIVNSLKAGSWDVLNTIGQNGGYFDLSALPAGMTADYMGGKVAYWQYGKDSMALTRQDVSAEIQKGVSLYGNGLRMTEFQGKKVTVGAVQNVQAEIKDNTIEMKVWMPVSMEGYAVSQPFSYTIPLRMGKIIKFANDMVSDNVQNRRFDTITTNAITMYQAKDEYGMPKVPSTGMLFGCGQFIFKGWYSVRPAMEELLQGAYANTYTAGKINTQRVRGSSYPSFIVPVYTELEAYFYGPDKLDERSFQMFPGTISAVAIPAPMTSLCISPPYFVNYWLYYPVIAEADDNDYTFKFAMPVYVDMSKPGDWGDVSVSLAQWKEDAERCEAAICDAGVKVLDKDGPVEYAQVTYSGCNLGVTAADGTLDAKVPCGIGQLVVYPRDMGGSNVPYTQLSSSDDMKDKQVYLLKKPLYQFHIKEIAFTNSSGSYSVSGVSDNSKTGTAMFSNFGLGYMTSALIGSSLMPVSTIVPGMNEVIVMLGLGSGDNARMVGGITVMNYTFTESATEYWMYVPVLAGGTDDGGVAKLNSVLAGCGISPINTQEYSGAVLNGCKG